jgi:RNA polymerase sigma factor (sigma-70 family)
MSGDVELLQRWRAGDAAAGNELFEKHFHSLLRFFRNKAPNDAEDLIQETLLACVHGRDRFEESQFRAYLFGIARKVFLKYCDRKYRSPDLDCSMTSVHALDPSPSRVLAQRQEQRLVLSALRAIPIDYQIALELYYWEGLRGPVLAQVLELPEPAVRSRLRRGLEHLRHALAQQSADPQLISSTLRDLEEWARSIRTVIDATA